MSSGKTQSQKVTLLLSLIKYPQNHQLQSGNQIWSRQRARKGAGIDYKCLTFVSSPFCSFLSPNQELLSPEAVRVLHGKEVYPMQNAKAGLGVWMQVKGSICLVRLRCQIQWSWSKHISYKMFFKMLDPRQGKRFSRKKGSSGECVGWQTSGICSVTENWQATLTGSQNTESAGEATAVLYPCL